MSFFGGRLGRIPNLAAVSSLSASAWYLSETQKRSSMTTTTITQCAQVAQPPNNKPIKKDCPKLIFLGTGSSTGCPKPICTLAFGNNTTNTNPTNDESNTEYHKKLASICNISNLAIHGDPKTNKNYRNNPSFLIHHQQQSPQNNSDDDDDNDDDNDISPPVYKNVIIDVGKTFREGALRWFPEFGIKSLDAIVITHHHMDAAAGLDDIRGFQKPASLLEKKKTGIITNTTPKGAPMPIYMSAFCYKNLQGQFPWLLPNKTLDLLKQDETQPIIERHVASFDVTIFQDYQPMTVVEDLKITPLPVWHGDDLICHGFAFSVPSSSSSSSKPPANVLYLSDISRMIPETLDYILTKLPPTDILIVDTLLWHKAHPVHFSLEQAVALSDQIAPKQTFLIGMNCDNFLPHEEMNALLKTKYGNVQLAHDGLAIDLE
jgi:phosphoribosyl 1,2-cyclic phosphodiesterase